MTYFEQIIFAANLRNAQIASQSVRYLGHIVGYGQLLVYPEKVDKIVNMKSLTCKEDVSTFIGICGYLARHLMNYSEVTLSFYQLYPSQCSI